MRSESSLNNKTRGSSTAFRGGGDLFIILSSAIGSVLSLLEGHAAIIAYRRWNSLPRVRRHRSCIVVVLKVVPVITGGYVCMVITYSRVWINRVRLPILHVVS